MLISADHPEECRVVITENGQLEEFIVEHAGQELLKGNVYLGVITRVEPGIEAAFVDIGWKKYGFLPFKDVLRESYLKTGEKKAKIRIQDVLIRGQRILVQVVKESREFKGPSLTNGITIPGRFLVLMNGTDSTGVSRKIEDETERKKLKSILAGLKIPEKMGVIIRTAGLGRTKVELQKDVQMLLKIWTGIQKNMKNDIQAPCMLYRGPDMVVRTVRDHFTADTSEIIVDNPVAFKALKEFMKDMMPRMSNRIKLYQDAKPLFSQYQIEEQVQIIYQRTVDLPSGGSIVFDTGEAMVCIDVNSGKTTGESDLELTALKTNLEAAERIGKELRLRDLGGLVVIDFIDMYQAKNKSLVERQLKQACKKDKARINMARLSRFGLMELSRQRISPPVKEAVFEKCSPCEGTGHIKSDNATALDVLRKVQNLIADGQPKKLAVVVSNSVVNYILNHKIKYLADLEEKHNVKIEFSSEDFLPWDKFAFTIIEKRDEEEKAVEQKSLEPQKSDEETAKGKSSEGRRERPRGRGRRPGAGTGQRRKYASRKTSTRRNGGERGRGRDAYQKKGARDSEQVENLESPVPESENSGKPVMDGKPEESVAANPQVNIKELPPVNSVAVEETPGKSAAKPAPEISKETLSQ